MKRIFVILLGVLLIAAMVSFILPSAERPDFDETANAEVKDLPRPVSLNEIAGGWNRFRGPNGTGVSADQTIPLTWSDDENLAWKTKLPGFGASSPVLTDQFVFLTAYSGYGTDQQNPGDISKLMRHVVCIARDNGETVWTRDFPSTATEDPYKGAGLPQHGYATNSAVTDGKRVFAFLGKSGVVALDIDGNELWKASVGTGSSNRQWGSAASLVLYGDLLIVNAAEESKTLYAFDAETGDVVWKSESAMLELCYSTPVVWNKNDEENELLLVVPNEIWGLNPVNGKTRWYADSPLGGNVSPGLIVDQDKAYAFGGYQQSGSVAIDLNAAEVSNQKDTLWTSKATSYVSTPVLLNGKFHWINGKGIYHCSDAKSGKLLFKSRVKGISGGGTILYASTIAIGGKVYIQTRNSGVFVIEPSDELNIVAQNKFESDESVFNATPSVDKGQLFLRSDTYLYCVQKSSPSS